MTVNNEAFEIKNDRIKLLYQNVLSGVLINFLVSCAIVFGFEHSSDHIGRVIWFIAMLGILIGRILDWHYWRKTAGTNQSSDLQRVRIGCTLTAAAWSFYSVYFFDNMSEIEFSTTVIIVAALAGGATTLLSADKLSSISYSTILLVPISIVGLVSDNPHHYVLGLLGISFAVIMATTSFKSSRFTLRAIKTKHHNERLVASQEKLLQEIHLHNEKLEETVSLRTKEVIRVSNIDPLTNLSNRKAFSTRLNDLISQADTNKQKIAILFIDLDGFKAINDQNGHATGDVVLSRVANRILDMTKNEHHACRWGGDEFIVAMVDVGIQQARTFATELINEIKQPIILNTNSLRVGATVGISMYPLHGLTGDDLILLADTAMYEQKQSNNANVLVFSEKMRETLLFKSRLKANLEYALANNQMYLTYQPVVDSSTADIIFCEALLRWYCDGNLVSPEDFIPIAEQHGFIHEIGAWVLNQACQDATRWEFAEHVGVSVNMSVAQIMHLDIINITQNAITQSGIAPHRLHIEITESLFAENLDKVIKVVRKLQALGAKVSIDDFGTGFSSLALLQNLSADIVKIDKCFIYALKHGGDVIIQATQSIAQDFKYDVVAEGVETAEQVEALKSMGIKYLQGYYFSKPLTFSDLNKFAEAHSNGITTERLTEGC
ncbi:EAL domain-containing protein [Paraglaciecola aquimarina]|uniref:EAL domain-containing protein n=1 Tax=Paraglaciecola aquimarina TaxID=1235557 RepID=A0ABU3SW51_9ALTE|nr:EAL domain-containing protein [Paraglaciecola aquimarina]MDU0354230.1 EAL domain-containing protein [Paraglaciecola aquimarina]